MAREEEAEDLYEDGKIHIHYPSGDKAHVSAEHVSRGVLPIIDLVRRQVV